MKRLSLAYGPVPEEWTPRETDGGTISTCRGCNTHYVDDFPNGGPLKSPCCPGWDMNRAVRVSTPLERLGWKEVRLDAAESGERDANARANGE